MVFFAATATACSTVGFVIIADHSNLSGFQHRHALRFCMKGKACLRCVYC
uniref:Uncharacterized protein n=1 Tax=Arundo donax TaxID=35708 RepID=A0A0A9HN02_ARUDO